MSEINPELVQNIEEARKRWLPAFAEITNNFLNSDDAITITANHDNSTQPESHRFIAFQSDAFICRLRVTRRSEERRSIVGDRVVLEWMQRPSPIDFAKGYSPEWGYITVGYARNEISALTEQMPKATTDDIEDWNNGKPATEIAELRYPINIDKPFVASRSTEMSQKDVVKLLLEAKDAKVSKTLTQDMADFYMEESKGFTMVPNKALGINIPAPLAQSISI